MPRLLLLLPTTTYRTAAFLGAARKLGVEVVVASERTHCSVGPRRAQMDAMVVPQEPPPRTTTLG